MSYPMTHATGMNPYVVPSQGPYTQPAFSQPYAGSVAPIQSAYAPSMYAADDAYYASPRGGHADQYYRPEYRRSRSYSDSHYPDYSDDEDYYSPSSRRYSRDDDYYGDRDRHRHRRYSASSRYYDRDPHRYSSSGYRQGYGSSYYDGGRYHDTRHHDALKYGPKVYQVTNSGHVKVLRYGHENFGDKVRRLCGMDPPGVRVVRPKH